MKNKPLMRQIDDSIEEFHKRIKVDLNSNPNGAALFYKDFVYPFPGRETSNFIDLLNAGATNLKFSRGNERYPYVYEAVFEGYTIKLHTNKKISNILEEGK